MRSNEVTDTLSLGSELILFTLLCTFLAIVSIQAGNIRSAKELKENTMISVREKSELYYYKYAEHVSGSDIVELIIKNNSKYDYYIKLSTINTNIEITKSRAKKLMEKGENSEILWTQSYLTNNIFVEHIYSSYDVRMQEDKNGALSFYFTER
ncbi:hypothetical protein acsn021_06600 [Anaerocolumna cellulosilytica]|uniref:Uncharacterized protein n=1 Tax=Anaerocolumna cellulosilytica TaxID=433286 RepID=A0A6S6R1J3_9FIRM|nr:SufD family Fe-S cluster assembly protein [Anaerocolumna cellulosilytica]MBB5197685.1 putative membrane protein [Anaerocolumna cellulosilytica]BCJ93091.1 hypothetical protein acsn021_06600 [Anaerocolumna cellulosilytica]